MTSKLATHLPADLGVTRPHSWPHVSNDNPFSESQFKTLKYCPEFPDNFDSSRQARGFTREFLPWCNHEHHHAWLGYLTPAVVHHGRTEEVLAIRQAALDAAFPSHPERFVHRPPRTTRPLVVVWINPPKPAPVAQYT